MGRMENAVRYDPLVQVTNILLILGKVWKNLEIHVLFVVWMLQRP